jgi:hypothetical protein
MTGVAGMTPASVILADAGIHDFRRLSPRRGTFCISTDMVNSVVLYGFFRVKSYCQTFAKQTNLSKPSLPHQIKTL